ncbi:hypothetical protein CBW42_00225 [Butyricicoccus porcorum]|uniref:Uncharacterized protein n=1 Tax=Butyricicoccus porcorum TaxID=1945634 RepID=A0A252F7E2_9FIRM|nr:hypothetical protein CBW42_00225 [Butyricicoccus porcorum]
MCPTEYYIQYITFRAAMQKNAVSHHKRGNRIPHPSGGYLRYRVRIGLVYLSSAGRVHQHMTYDTRRGFLLRR